MPITVTNDTAAAASPATKIIERSDRRARMTVTAAPDSKNVTSRGNISALLPPAVPSMNAAITDPATLLNTAGTAPSRSVASMGSSAIGAAYGSWMALKK